MDNKSNATTCDNLEVEPLEVPAQPESKKIWIQINKVEPPKRKVKDATLSLIPRSIDDSLKTEIKKQMRSLQRIKIIIFYLKA